MGKKKLRLLKRGAPIIGLCEGCLAQFRSVFTGVMAAQSEIRIRFAAHKCMATDRSHTAKIQKAA